MEEIIALINRETLKVELQRISALDLLIKS